MDPGRIDHPPALTPSGDYHWTRTLVQWMGHLWSLSSFALMALITRISRINCFFYPSTETSLPTPSLPNEQAPTTPSMIHSASTEEMIERTSWMAPRRQSSDRCIIVPPSPIRESPHFNKNYVMIEAGTGGNCMLHSIALGLRLQKFEKTYSHSELRRLGVDFVRKEINLNGTHAQTLRGYVDADRGEHNRLNPNQQIDSQEQFLQHLEQDGFPCSGTHLFSLSCILNIPIYIFNQEGVKGHRVQLLNPREANNTHAIFVGLVDAHYRLIVSANIYAEDVISKELESLTPPRFFESP